MTSAQIRAIRQTPIVFGALWCVAQSERHRRCSMDYARHFQPIGKHARYAADARRWNRSLVRDVQWLNEVMRWQGWRRQMSVADAVRLAARLDR